MPQRGTWQLHASVNTDWSDSAVRVTFTAYDEDGFETATRTWRRHVKALQMDQLEWQAFAAVSELHRLMAHVCQSDLRADEPDEPLPLL